MALLPLHFFSSSILSQYPSPSFNSTPLIQTRRSSAVSIFNSHRVEIPISHSTEELENQQYPERRIASYVIKKKKKKLRPSFYDQTRERWSVKMASQRTKFPWQQQKQQQYSEYSEAEEEEEEEEEEESSSRKKEKLVVDSFPSIFNSAIPLDATKGEDPWSEKPVSLAFKNRTILAPWAHGDKHRKTHLNSEGKLHVPVGKIERHTEGEEKEGLEIHRWDAETAIGNMVGSLEDFKRGGDANFEEEENSSSSEDGDDGNFTSSVVEKMKVFSGDAKSSSLNGKRSGFSDNVPSFPDLISDSSENQSGIRNGRDGELMMGSFYSSGLIQSPWEKEKWSRSNTELAEKIVPEPELRRLRNVALRMKERLTVGVAGITQAIVDEIHEKWKEVEVVKIKFEGPLAVNMKRTHNILESKTGGLVVWRCGSSVVLYRGMAYELPCVQSYAKHSQATLNNVPRVQESISQARTAGVSSMPEFEDPYDEFTDIADVNNMLDELGPRFLDWSGYNPVPVDADLLPGVVPGYKPPFRFLPYGIKQSLQNREMTNLRRLARKVPPHFALGRNRQHQGLAQAIVKLWEKSVIAKIAIKRGVLNTCNERMAEEIKNLTGGTLLSRNKDYIVLYRGNDFLSPAMKDALLGRQRLTILRQDEEEQARMKALDSVALTAKAARGPFVAGTLAETMEARSRWGHQPSCEEIEKMKRDETLAKHASLVRHLENKLAKAQEKVIKAEKALHKVQTFLEPAELPTDLETVTDEERFLFRKIGLSMKPYLLLGRRGVFDGTVENMHLHWKYKELVKIIVKGKSFPQVKHFAVSLEAESGGILISLDKTSKGYAIIFYRGKNYQRPQTMRPKNLLTKRQALARSIELQRREALNHHISELRERIELLKSELEQMESVEEIDDRDLYSQLADAYPSDDDLEDEGEEAFLRTYDSGNESDNSERQEFASEIE